MQETITLDSKVTLNSKSREFKEKVIQYGTKNIGKYITFELFEKWLNNTGYRLMTTDKYWKAVFASIFKYQFYFDISYQFDCNNQLITMFNIKSGRKSVNNYSKY